MRHTSSVASNPVSSHARSMDGAVSLPSKLWVKSRIGMRMMEGNRPK